MCACVCESNAENYCLLLFWWCIFRVFVCFFAPRVFFTHCFSVGIITMHYIRCCRSFLSHRLWSSSYFGFINKIHYDAVFIQSPREGGREKKTESGHRIYIFDRGEIKYLHKIKHFHYIDSITLIVSRNSLFIDSTNGLFVSVRHNKGRISFHFMMMT